jgi:uncharacterized membrane protein YphA (DoxX/SURF4 family)
MYGRLVTAVRLLLGAAYVVGGGNWFFKLIDPYPSIVDYLNAPPPDDIVGALIRTGILFHMVKIVELVAGIALLSNRFVPLALVLSAPVTVVVFVVDVFVSGHTRAVFMGTGSFAMHGFLLLAYMSVYRPMLAPRVAADRL